MTERAREALADCEHALADFEASANTPYQRPRWVAVITLLRIVGHVLDKVDKPAASKEAQPRIDNAWKQLNATKAEPRIFHDFIDGDRNLLLKQYAVRSRVNVTIQLGGVGPGGWSTPSGPPIYDFIMRDGPFKGRDPRELCREAIAFWKEYLDAIDAEPNRMANR